MVGRAGTVPGHEVRVHDPAEGEERQENNHPVTCQGPIPTASAISLCFRALQHQHPPGSSSSGAECMLNLKPTLRILIIYFIYKIILKIREANITFPL